MPESCKMVPRFSQPGNISQFYSYAGQVSSFHDQEDTFNARGLQTLQGSPSVVDASRAFQALWKANAPWSEAEDISIAPLRWMRQTPQLALDLLPTEVHRR